MKSDKVLLSVITVARENCAGLIQTWQSLSHLACAQNIGFEWIVVDGCSQDGTLDFLEQLNGQYGLRYVSEKDDGIYDAMNKGIAMAQGQYALFLNSGDIFHENVAEFMRVINEGPHNNVMYIGDVLLNYGNGIQIRRSAKHRWYIYHSLPASHQAIMFPVAALKDTLYDLQYKVSSDYALVAKLYKSGILIKRIKGFVSEFFMGGISTSNNIGVCQDAKKIQVDILNMPKPLANLSFCLRLCTTSKSKLLYNKS